MEQTWGQGGLVEKRVGSRGWALRSCEDPDASQVCSGEGAAAALP